VRRAVAQPRVSRLPTARDQGGWMEPLEPSSLLSDSNPSPLPNPRKTPEIHLNPTALSADPSCPPPDLQFEGPCGSIAGATVVRRPPSPSATGVEIR